MINTLTFSPMKKSYFLAIVIFSLSIFPLIAQDTLYNHKALNFPTRKYGISIGNSKEFNGVRINWKDRDVLKVNGINITFGKSQIYTTQEVNGLNLGFVLLASKMGLVNLGIIGVATKTGPMNGLSLGGLVVGSGNCVNGLVLAGLMIHASGKESILSGVSIAGFGIGAGKAINGVAISSLSVSTDGNINGFASSLGAVTCKKNYNGVAISGIYIGADIFNGIALSAVSKTRQMNGLSIALVNTTKELHGFQLGLINYAGNNGKGLKVLPVINMHLGKNNR